jgi:hypothetical protein
MHTIRNIYKKHSWHSNNGILSFIHLRTAVGKRPSIEIHTAAVLNPGVELWQ